MSSISFGHPSALAGVLLLLTTSLTARPAAALEDHRDAPRCLQPLAAPAGASPARLLLLLMASYDWRNQAGLEVATRERPPDPGELEKTARGFLGVPYSWGGVKECGFDCSGFTNRVYALNGYDLPRNSREQFKVGQEVDPRRLERGDLVFFSTHPGETHITHVGMYLDDDTFIHAARGKGEVTFDRLSSRYYSQRLVGARRVLALPPGRYSTSHGTALAGYLVRGDQPIPRRPPVQPTVRLATSEPSEDPIAALIEHAEADRPVQLAASTSINATITRAGPELSFEDSTAFGLRLGAGHMNGAPSLLAVPEFTYFGHDNALRVALAAPFHVSGGIRGEELAGRTGWSHWRDWTKILREVSFGTKDADLYLDLGRTASGTLGHGQLMRYFTPNIASRYVPRYALEADALSLAFDGSLPWGRFELFLDDVLRPEVVGMSFALQPLAGSGTFFAPLSVAFTYAGDWRAPYQPLNPDDPTEGFTTRRVHAAGATAELPVLRRKSLDLRTYLDGSALWHESGLGAGSALGLLLRSDRHDRRPHALRVRLEGRLSTPTFLPSYFDATYRLHRAHAPSPDPEAAPLTRLALLDELAGTPARWSVYSELNYQYMRSLLLGVALEHGAPFAGDLDAPALDRVRGANLMAWVGLRNRYLPGSRKRYSAHLAYHLRNVHSFGELFSGHRPNEYLFATVSVHLHRFVSVGGSLRKALDPERAGRSAIDGVIDASFHYEL